MLFDTHMHTSRFSTDSKMSIDKAISKAKELNIGITTTEHMDLAYPVPDAFIFDVGDYFAEYEKYRSNNMLLGIEVGMRLDCLKDNNNIVSNHSFDYVIGSIHVIDNIDIYCEEFYLSRTKQEVYHHYLDTMTECLKVYDFIDTLGHIDYITRYARYADPEIHYEEFREHIDQVLTILAEKEKAIEINTRRLNKDTVQTLIPIYKRFHELGGRWATIGSDAHRPEDIGKGIDSAINISSICNLDLVYFKNRSPEYIKL